MPCLAWVWVFRPPRSDADRVVFDIVSHVCRKKSISLASRIAPTERDTCLANDDVVDTHLARSENKKTTASIDDDDDDDDVMIDAT